MGFVDFFHHVRVLWMKELDVMWLFGPEAILTIGVGSGKKEVRLMKVSVIIPNRNDTIMLGITVRNILEELKAVGSYDDSEIIIVDNSDEDIWHVIKTVNISPIPLSYVQEGKVKLFRQHNPCLWTARESAVRRATGKYVVNTDSHTMYGRDSLKDLVDFMDTTEEKVGFGYSPIGWVTAPESFARHDIKPENGSIYGPWGRQYYRPTKICWNFGAFIANREWFIHDLDGHGFFAKKRRGWGGGEFYMAIKSWLLGWENWAIPSAPQYHLGPWSKEVEKLCGYRYRTYVGSGNGSLNLNLLASLYALAGEYGKEYARKNPQADIHGNWEEAKKIAEEDRKWIERKQVMSFEQFVTEKPWMEGWDESRWDSWKPHEDIKIVTNLNKLG